MAASMRAVRKNPKRSVRITLGELVAAAFDAVGGEVDRVGRLLGSRQIAQAAGRRILVTE